MQTMRPPRLPHLLPLSARCRWAPSDRGRSPHRPPASPSLPRRRSPPALVGGSQRARANQAIRTAERHPLVRACFAAWRTAWFRGAVLRRGRAAWCAQYMARGSVLEWRVAWVTRRDSARRRRLSGAHPHITVLDHIAHRPGGWRDAGAPQARGVTCDHGLRGGEVDEAEGARATLQRPCPHLCAAWEGE